jgi:hypothetical protein
MNFLTINVSLSELTLDVTVRSSAQQCGDPVDGMVGHVSSQNIGRVLEVLNATGSLA